MIKSLLNEMASAPLGAHNGNEVYILEGAETAATASSTQVENELEQVGSRKSRSQAGAELGLQVCDRFAPNEGCILPRQRFSVQVMRAPSGALMISRGGCYKGRCARCKRCKAMRCADTVTNETTWTLKGNTTNEKI